MSRETDPQVQLTHDLLKEYSSARSKWAKQATEDNEFRSGVQWKDEHVKTLRERAQEPVVVNVVHSAVEQAKALLTTNKPRFQSTGRENSDTKTGRIFSELMTWIWDNSNGNVQLKQVVDDYYVKGMGALYAYYDPNADYGKGEIMLKSVNPHDLYLDPASKDPFCQDSAHIIVAKKHMKSQLLLEYPDYADLIQSAVQTNYISPETTTRFGLHDEQVTSNVGNDRRLGDDDIELEVMERYTKVKQPYIRAYNPLENEEDILTAEDFEEYLKNPAVIVTTTDGEQIHTESTMVDKYRELYENTDGMYHMVPNPMTGQPMMQPGKESPNMIPNSTTVIELIPYKKLVDGGTITINEITIDHIEMCCSIGDVQLFMTTIPIEHYPIVTFMNRHNRNPYPISDVRLVKGLQEYINKIRSLIVAHASSSTNVKLLIPRGSMNKQQLEAEWARAGTAVIEFDPELGQPIVAGPVPLPNELYKNESDAKADIERILGIYALMQGDQGAAPQTYKGTIALDEFGQRRIKSKKDDIEAGLNQMGKVIIQFIQAYYSSEKTIRLMNPNALPTEITINQDIYNPVTGMFVERLNDVTIGKYDMIVVSGSTLPSNKWARFEYYMQLYQTGLIDQVEVLKQTDVADMEGVLERNDQRNQMANQIQQLQAQVKQLSGDLQTAQRESVQDRKRVEVKEFEKKLAKAEAKIEMATTLHSKRSQDELDKLKDAVSEVEKDTEDRPPRKVVPITV
tara:strand:+ start:1001 stop:3214 length:2214 start_codon:yes stop_codon:yes gene_type:complete